MNSARVKKIQHVKMNTHEVEFQVVEQPKSASVKFLKSEQLPSPQSYIIGENSTIGRETHPSILLTNFRGLVKLVWHLVADSGLYPHPYMLEGEDCQGGVCTKTVQSDGQIISFPGLYVRCVDRKDVQQALRNRLDILSQHVPGVGFMVKGTKEYDYESVRICYQALPQEYTVFLTAFTRLLKHFDASMYDQPRILSISHCKGSVRGREELSLQVTNLRTDDVNVFFYCDNLEPRSSWQAFGSVTSIVCKKNKPVTIDITTPPYYDQRTTEPQTVDIQVRLTNDDSASNTIKYTYMPQIRGVVKLRHRMKQKQPIYVKHFTCLDNVARKDQVLAQRKEHNSAESYLESPKAGVDDTPSFVREEALKIHDEETEPPELTARSRRDANLVSVEDCPGDFNSEDTVGPSKDLVDYDLVQRYCSLMISKDSTTESSSSCNSEQPTHCHGSLTSGNLSSPPVIKVDEAESVDDSGNSRSIHSQLQNREEETVMTGSSDSHFPRNSSTPASDWKQRNVESKTKTSSKNVKRRKVKSKNKSSSKESCRTVSVKSCTSVSSSPHHELPFLTPLEVDREYAGAFGLSSSHLLPAVLKRTELVAIREIPYSEFHEESFQLWHSLKHKSLVTLLGMVKGDAVISVVLEFPANRSLKECLLSRVDSHPWKMRLTWIQQAAGGLHCLHENGMFHGEVMSENCLITRTNDLKLGIPSTLALARKPGDGNAFKVVKDKACDVFSFSKLLWDLLQVKSVAGSVEFLELHYSQREHQQHCIILIIDDCTKPDEFQRPTMRDIVCRLQSILPGILPGMQEIPSGTLAPSSSVGQTPELVLKQKHINAPQIVFAECGPISPDSGYGIAKPSKPALYGNNDCSPAESIQTGTSDPSSMAVQGVNNLSNSGTALMNNQAANQDGANNSAEDSIGEDGEDRKRHKGDVDQELGSHLRPPRVTQRVDHTGGEITLPNCDVTLSIPAGALKEGQVEEITLSIDWDDRHIPAINVAGMNASPIVNCGPTGLKFEKPVQLHIPHCAVIRDTKRCKATVYVTDTKEGDPPRWKGFSEGDRSDIKKEIRESSCVLQITHFTGYAVCFHGQSTLCKEIMAVAYGNYLGACGIDQEIRIYLYDATSSNSERIRQEEHHNGKKLNGPFSFQMIHLHEGDMAVQLNHCEPSWLLKSDIKCEFLFRKIWNLRSWSGCSFVFESKAQFKTFRCKFSVTQHNNDDGVQLNITNSAKMPPESLSSNNSVQRLTDPSSLFGDHVSTVSQETYNEAGRRSADFCFLQQQFNLFQNHASSDVTDYCKSEIIPYKLESALCHLLDQTDDFVKDWRSLADLFEFGKSTIQSWESKQKVCETFSPTKYTLRFAEKKKFITSLSQLRCFLCSIERIDAAEIIDSYESNRAIQQQSSTEDMCTCNTPSSGDAQASALEFFFERFNNPSTNHGEGITENSRTEQNVFTTSTTSSTLKASHIFNENNNMNVCDGESLHSEAPVTTRTQNAESSNRADATPFTSTSPHGHSGSQPNNDSDDLAYGIRRRLDFHEDGETTS